MSNPRSLDSTYSDVNLDEKDKEKMETDLKNLLFKSQDLDLQNANPNSVKIQKVDVDNFREIKEIKIKDSNGRNIIHRLALESGSAALSSLFQNL